MVRFGHWYLVAYDLDREAQRTFRVDRIDSEVTRHESSSTTALPDHVEIDVEAALPDEPWDTDDDDRVDVRIRVDAVVARRVADEVGQDKVVARHDDGSIDVLLEVSSFSSIRSWLLGLLDHAVVVEPSAFRDEMVAWLEALVSALPASANQLPPRRSQPTRSRPSQPRPSRPRPSPTTPRPTEGPRTPRPPDRPARPRRRRRSPLRCARPLERRRAVACVGCSPWWAGSPRWARRRWPTSPSASA